MQRIVLLTILNQDSMKDLWKSGVLILLIIGTLYILFLRECKRPLPCPAEDEMIIKLAVWDSILAIADIPPIVKRDTIYIKGDTEYVEPPLPDPIPDLTDEEINSYQDSIVNKEIDVHYNFEVKGILLNRKWEYKPIQTEIKVDSIVYIPKLVNTIEYVETASNGLYLSGMAGGNKSAFLFGGGLDLITKKETLIGYQFQRFGDLNFHSIRLGAKIKLFK